MGYALFTLALAIAAAAGFVHLWRNQRAMREEIAALKRTVTALETRAAAVAAPRKARRADLGVVAPVSDVQHLSPMAEPAPITALRAGVGVLDSDQPTLSPATLRVLALAIAATLPAFALFFGVAATAVVSFGLLTATAMLLVGLRPDWSHAAWAGLFSATAWTSLGYGLGAASAAPIAFALPLAALSLAGLIHLYVKRAPPGAGAALLAAAMALALASETSVVGPGGLAFGVAVAAAAIIGALSIKLEALHLAAFGAALLGLFVLSGQPSAAIWFTPMTTWAGALFLAIAALRVPQAGARATTLAATGVFAPLGAIAVLHFAGHGLAHPLAAAAALLTLAGALAGIAVAAATRRERGFVALGLTAWILVLGAWASIAGAFALPLPAPFAAPMIAALSLAALGLNSRFRHAAWRVCAILSLVAAGAFALRTAGMTLSEDPRWPSWALILAGLALTSALCAAAAYLAHRQSVPFTASAAEAASIAIGVIGANVTLRVLCTGGVVLLTPVGFVEACLHISVWAATALGLAYFSNKGASKVREAASIALALWAGFVLLLAGAMWVTPYWIDRGDGALALLTHHALGVVAPALLFVALWWAWRTQNRDARARGALIVGTLSLAGAAALALIRAEGAPDWAPALGGAAAFATAVAVNFSAGVTRRFQSSK